jgi:hypothetical protein
MEAWTMNASVEERETSTMVEVRKVLPDCNVFDWAIPLEHHRILMDAYGDSVHGMFVTAYAPSLGSAGQIVAITETGRWILKIVGWT